MQNVTYILGAGASYPRIPIVSEWPERLRAFYEHVGSLKDIDKYDVRGGFPESLSTTQHMILTEIDWILSKIDGITIDEVARLAHLNDPSGKALKAIKCLIMIFVRFYQAFRANGNSRYDKFLLNVLRNEGNDITLPPNLRILSWNYDTEFENSIRKNFSFNVTPERFVQSHPYLIQSAGVDLGKPGLYHLNGVCDIGRSRNEENAIFPIPVEAVGEVSLLRSLVEVFRNVYFHDSYSPMIHFAFEERPFEVELRSRVSSAISQTDILVVIGYSFPNFNRETDSFLLSKMPNLTKIYIQDHQLIGARIETRMRDILGTRKSPDIRQETDLDSFFIPIELSQGPS